MKLNSYINYSKIQKLSEGFRSKSFLLDNKYIFLEGCNKKSYSTYKKDCKILRFLADRITSVEIPHNMILIKKDEDHPNGGLIYSLINDKVFNYDEIEEYNLRSIALGISGFLNELHSIKVNYDHKSIITKDLKNITSNIKQMSKYLDKDNNIKLNRFYQLYKSYTDNHHDMCLVHGDLWYENYIISKDGSTLKGIIDFENCKYFYPIDDLVPMLYISEEFLNDVLKNYCNKVDKKDISIFRIRREVVSFKYIMKYFPEESEEQLEKIIEVLSLID